MNKQEIIHDIESLFPVDSDFTGTAIAGEGLLIEAIKRHNWRDLPEDILNEYHKLCIELDKHQYYHRPDIYKPYKKD